MSCMRTDKSWLRVSDTWLRTVKRRLRIIWEMAKNWLKTGGGRGVERMEVEGGEGVKHSVSKAWSLLRTKTSYPNLLGSSDCYICTEFCKWRLFVFEFGCPSKFLIFFIRLSWNLVCGLLGTFKEALGRLWRYRVTFKKIGFWVRLSLKIPHFFIRFG